MMNFPGRRVPIFSATNEESHLDTGIIIPRKSTPIQRGNPSDLTKNVKARGLVKRKPEEG